MRRFLTAGFLGLSLVAAGCSSGTQAPPPEPLEGVCTEVFCLEVPVDWSGETAQMHVAFNHTADPEATFLTASVVDSEALVVAAGGSWPATTDEVVQSFWALLEDAGEGELIRTERMVGGAVRSWGSHSTGDMWFVLVPIEGTVAVGVEIRGPNDTWETHADAVFPTVIPNT